MQKELEQVKEQYHSNNWNLCLDVLVVEKKKKKYRNCMSLVYFSDSMRKDGVRLKRVRLCLQITKCQLLVDFS